MNLTVCIEAFDESVSLMLLQYEKIRALPKASIKIFDSFNEASNEAPNESVNAL